MNGWPCGAFGSLPRRDLEEALVLDEALRLELRLLLERVPDDFVL